MVVVLYIIDCDMNVIVFFAFGKFVSVSSRSWAWLSVGDATTILEQDFGSGLQPIAFSSRKLNSTEIHYSAYERELLGIVWPLANGNIISRAHTP